MLAVVLRFDERAAALRAIAITAKLSKRFSDDELL
jgi:hypothetical protein